MPVLNMIQAATIIRLSARAARDKSARNGLSEYVSSLLNDDETTIMVRSLYEEETEQSPRYEAIRPRMEAALMSDKIFDKKDEVK